MILDGLKKRFYDENSKKGGKWISELPHVVWGASDATFQRHRAYNFLSCLQVKSNPSYGHHVEITKGGDV